MTPEQAAKRLREAFSRCESDPPDDFVHSAKSQLCWHCAVDFVNAVITDARARALDEAMKATCLGCAFEDTAAMDPKNPGWHADGDQCRSASIRGLAGAQGEGSYMIKTAAYEEAAKTAVSVILEIAKQRDTLSFSVAELIGNEDKLVSLIFKRCLNK